MSAILFLIPLSVAIAAAFLAAFIWSVRAGQFDDTCTPAMRILTEENLGTPKKRRSKTDES